MRAVVRGVGVMALLFAGCLTEGERGRSDADTPDTADTADTADSGGDSQGDTGQDTGADSADGDTGPSCTVETCDDNDPCTLDECDPSTGLCVHISMGGGGGAVPAPGCFSDPDCDDLDPCTVDRCATSVDECGVTTTACVQELIPGCVACASGCDDGNPCTLDECLDTICFNSFEDGCSAECVGDPVTSIAALKTQFGTDLSHLATVGTLIVHPLALSCDDGPTCDCTGFPGLTDELYDLPLRTSSTGSDAWYCQTSGCVESFAACAPAILGVRYKVWGRGLQEWELTGATDPVPGAVPVPAPVVAGLAAEGYCLDTGGTSLVGQYAGRLEVAGYSLSFSATIDMGSDGSLWLEYGGSLCEACPLSLSGARVPLTVGDGWVEIDALLPSLTGAQQEHVRLYANRNDLMGRYGVRGGLVPFIALAPGGLMVLSRVGP